MKKVVILILLIPTTFVFAEINFGLKFGVQLANIRSKYLLESQSSNYRTSFNGGFVLRIGLHKNFAIQPEFLFSSLGGIIRSTKSELIQNNLQFPVLFKYCFGFEKLRFFLNAGPYIGLNLSTDLVYQGKNLYFNPKLINQFDAGLLFGFGFEINMGSGVFVFEPRITRGFTDIFNDEIAKTNGEKNYTQALSFNLMYLFKVPK